MRMEDMMTSNVAVVHPGDSIRKAAKVFRTSRSPALPVVNQEGKLVGLLTRSNFLDALLEGHSLDESLEGLYIGDVLNVASLDLPYEEVVNIAMSTMAGVGVVVDDCEHVRGLFTKVNLIEALLKREEKANAALKAIYGAIGYGFISLDKNLEIKIFNPAAEGILGVEAKDVLGRPFNSVIKNRQLQGILQSGRAVTNFKCSFGKTVTLVSCTPVKSEFGTEGMTIIFQDITEVEATALELESIKRMYQTTEIILDTAYEGIVVIDEKGVILFVNKAYADFFGVTVHGIIGKNITDLKEKAMLTVVVNTGVPQLNVLETYRNTPYVVSRLPIVQEGKNVGAIEKIVFQNVHQLSDLAARLKALNSQVNYYREELKRVRERQCVYDFDDIIAVSQSMCLLKEEAALAARGISTILITGESGTGKELFAHAVHRSSTRRAKPFIKVNCSAIPENLLESEFFGYSPGAFTGAKRSGKAGRFQLANGGTLFLDEIGDMPPSLQVKLLRVLQDRSFERIGGTTTVHVDVRIIAATNQNLEKKVQEGSFRADLYYRLNVIQLDIPPLRDRPEDILPLANAFIRKYNRVMGIKVERIDGETLGHLLKYDWPGNARELENVIERAMNFTSGRFIDRSHLPRYLLQDGRHGEGVLVNTVHKRPVHHEESEHGPYQNYIQNAERKAIMTALQAAGGNKTKAAQILGLSRSWLYEKMARLEIT